MQNEIDIKKHYPCPVCGGIKNKFYKGVRKFSIVRCLSCSMIYVNPRIANGYVYDLYRKEYFHRKEYGYENYELNEDLKRKTFSHWYKSIEKYICTLESALDIGCAAGYFLDILKNRGWKSTEGIELDISMYNSLLRQGYNVDNKPLEFFRPCKKYDLITLFDVAEHLPHINTDFNVLLNILNDSGIIVMVTPNVNSVQRKIMGCHWFQFKPMEHIYYFSVWHYS